MLITGQSPLPPTFAQPNSYPFEQVDYLAIQTPSLFTLIEQIGSQTGVSQSNIFRLKTLKFETESSYGIYFRESITAYFKRQEKWFVDGKTADYIAGGYNPNWAGSYARREQELDLPQTEESSEAEQMETEEIPLPDLASIDFFSHPKTFLQTVEALEESAVEKVLKYMKTPKMQKTFEEISTAINVNGRAPIPSLKRLALHRVTEKLIELLRAKAGFSPSIIDIAYKMGHLKLVFKLYISNTANNTA